MLFPRLETAPITLGDDRGKVEILYETDRVVLKRSSSSAGVFRGLHRQVAPHLQDKIIRVISGRIIDFVTDPDDPEDPIWHSEIGPEDGWVHIAAQYAHGFYALEDVVFEYFCEGGYMESAEESWYIAPQVTEMLGGRPLLLSDKDQHGTPLPRPLKQAPDHVRRKDAE